MKVVGLTLAILTVASAYPQGPPVGPEHPDLCQHMFPTGHAATVQNRTAPYMIITNQRCYKEGSTIEVRIKTTDLDWYFEGFFVQARMGSSDTAAYGMFDTMDQEGVQLLDCFGDTSNAIGQSLKEHYYVRTFKWTAPQGVTGNVHFVATLVKNVRTFWTGVKSEEIMYDAGCVDGASLENEDFPDIQPDSPHTGTSSMIGSNILVISLILAIIKTLM